MPQTIYLTDQFPKEIISSQKVVWEILAGAPSILIMSLKMFRINFWVNILPQEPYTVAAYLLSIFPLFLLPTIVSKMSPQAQDQVERLSSTNCDQIWLNLGHFIL